jgi:hypothetical protein
VASGGEHCEVSGGERGERRRARRASEVRRERRGGAEARRAGGDRSGRRLARAHGAGKGDREKDAGSVEGVILVLLSVKLLWRIYWWDAPQNWRILWRIPPVDVPQNLFPFFKIF